MRPDVVIVGSGFAGSILAERLSRYTNKTVLIIEQRPQIAGNMFDYQSDNGMLVHKCGPHLFRTSNTDVVQYLSQFTQWYPYHHRVLADVDGLLVPVPFNLTSLERLMPKGHAQIKNKLIEEYGINVKVPISKLREHEDEEIKKLGQFIFEKIYKNYTIKQWGDDPKNLDFDLITKRVPVHLSYDDRYFQESFQALPLHGYTKMFEKMLDHQNISVKLRKKACEVLDFDEKAKQILFEGQPFMGDVIYSGPIDEIFNYSIGELPYRSLRFEVESHNMNYYQETGTVNYPNDHAFTRITEYKHLSRNKRSKGTVIMREFPLDYDRNNEKKNIPYYPVPKEESAVLYDRYLEKCKSFENLHLIGRLAEYRYYDMNDIVCRALSFFEDVYVKGKHPLCSHE